MAKKKQMVWITRQFRLTGEWVSVAERVGAEGRFVQVKWRGSEIYVLKEDVHPTEAKARARVDELVAIERAGIASRLLVLRQMKASGGTQPGKTLQPKGKRP